MSSTTPASDELRGFIGTAKSHGITDEFLTALLRKNGWSERRVFKAFTAYYADALGAPIPARSGTAENARDAFLYLINFIMLGFWTVALGQIMYALIAHWFPDATQNYPYAMPLRDQISRQLATVLVTFPIFAIVHRLIQTQLQKRSDLYDSGVRKWLTYVALVLASLVVVTDAIWFLEALLRGELTVRFVLDSLVLLALGGGVFGYYLLTVDPPKVRA